MNIVDRKNLKNYLSRVLKLTWNIKNRISKGGDRMLKDKKNEVWNIVEK